MIEGQQQLVNLFAGNLFLADQLELRIYFVLLSTKSGWLTMAEITAAT